MIKISNSWKYNFTIMDYNNINKNKFSTKNYSENITNISEHDN